MSDYCMCHIKNYWQELVTLSSQEFIQEAYTKALSYSKEALYRAEVLATHSKRCEELQIPFAEIYTFSCENLAQIYQQIGEPLQAEKVLKQGILFLSYLYKQRLLKKNIFEEKMQTLSSLFC
ncbi:hypothetical protein [Capnocytophaga sputigena]|jgi:hypothetical protein|uniref:hypothetical protein n=1 Tax=Capnocytophaga sputigena TaxID=1019 RepID=UPI001E6060BA|nr:hypothetical protein [Capnocytophaga sputigena]